MKAKNPRVAYWLCFCLGGLGAHYYYLGQYRKAIASTLFCWTGIPTIISVNKLHLFAADANS